MLFLILVAFLLGGCGQELDPAPPGSFSIVALPDTQDYTSYSPGIFHRQVKWILDNQEDQEIIFVTHLGDIVEWNTPSEWLVADAAMKPLDARIAYGLTVGNHDLKRKTSDVSRYSKTFPGSRFAEYSWYGDDYPEGTNQNSYQLVEHGGIRFLILHLICNAPDPVLEWASGVLESNPDRRVIVSTHMFLGALDEPDQTEGVPDGPTGVMRWKKVFGDAGNTPQQIWDKLLSKHASIFLILSGDQADVQAVTTTLTGEHGNKVQAAMSDYGDGSFRIYRFLPAEDRIQAITYSVEKNGLVQETERVSDAARHQFSMPVSILGASPN